MVFPSFTRLASFKRSFTELIIKGKDEVPKPYSNGWLPCARRLNVERNRTINKTPTAREKMNDFMAVIFLMKIIFYCP